MAAWHAWATLASLLLDLFFFFSFGLSSMLSRVVSSLGSSVKGGRVELGVSKSTWNRRYEKLLTLQPFFVLNFSFHVRKTVLTSDILDSLVDIQVTHCCMLKKRGYNPEARCYFFRTEFICSTSWFSTIPKSELISFDSLYNPRRHVCARACDSHRSEISQMNGSVALPVSFHEVRSRHAAELRREEFSSQKLKSVSETWTLIFWQEQIC